jgi:hypothetical protein
LPIQLGMLWFVIVCLPAGRRANYCLSAAVLLIPVESLA